MAFSVRRAHLATALLALLPVVAAAQDPATIRGRVTAENAATLPGVAIAIPELGLASAGDTGSPGACHTLMSSGTAAP